MGRLSRKEVRLAPELGHQPCGARLHWGTFFDGTKSMLRSGEREGRQTGGRDGEHQPCGARLHWSTFFDGTKSMLRSGEREGRA
ncbi:MAG: hypothetical protein PVI07_07505, partial [Anaerolineae bacterium]